MEATPAQLCAMTKPFKPLAGLTAPLRGLLMAALVTDLAAVLTDVYVSLEYADVPGDQPYDGLFLESDGLNGMVSLGQSAIGLAALIVFLMWVHRANRNLRLLSGESLAVTPGWAVGWFFIPVASLWMPYVALREIWTVSHRGTQRGAALVGWWWAAMLAQAAASVVASAVAGEVLTAADNARAAVAWEFGDAFLALMHVATWLLVGAIARAYARRVVEPPAAAVPAMGGAAGMVPVWPETQAPATQTRVATAPWVAPAGVPAAWYPDPLARHEVRWWDGAQWTAYVADAGVQAQDPL